MLTSAGMAKYYRCGEPPLDRHAHARGEDHDMAPDGDGSNVSRARYEADGYLLDLPMLNAAEVAGYRAVYDRLEREHTES
jgi:hypothetical protein